MIFSMTRGSHLISSDSPVGVTAVLPPLTVPCLTTGPVGRGISNSEPRGTLAEGDPLGPATSLARVPVSPVSERAPTGSEGSCIAPRACGRSCAPSCAPESVFQGQRHFLLRSRNVGKLSRMNISGVNRMLAYPGGLYLKIPQRFPYIFSGVIRMYSSFPSWTESSPLATLQVFICVLACEVATSRSTSSTQ